MAKKKASKKSGSFARQKNVATHAAAKWLGMLFAIGMLGAAVFLIWNPPWKPGRPAPGKNSEPKPANEAEVFASYGGSASCKDCHEEAYNLWNNSNHALAERLPEAALDETAFVPARSFTHGTQKTFLERDGTNYQIASIGLSQGLETNAVIRVIGRDPLRQFLVSAPGGRLQTMEASFDPARHEWFNVYGREDRQPGEWGHWTGRGMNWNDMCASCHNTRVRKNYDPASDSYHTTMAEMTVGCEACHGPLQAHNLWQNQFGKSGRKDPTLKKLDRAQVLDSCGSCHARRSDLTGDFKPGDNFQDDHELAIVDYSDTYYPDGQVRDEDYEYASFLSSRMHFRGVICTDCHQPHSAKTILPGNWLCMRCHDGSYTNAPVIQPVSHSHHLVHGYDTNGVMTNSDLTGYQSKTVKETGGECINCHMPQTPYMQRHWRHDHGFTIPDPLLTKEFGIPNACNRCHADKDTAWSLAAAEKWYGSRMDRPSRRRAETIARARAGDPAAREPLLTMLAGEDIPYWRAVAAGMLGPWSAEPTVRAALLKSLESTNALVRAKTVRALNSPGLELDDTVSKALAQRLEDPARSVRLNAALALQATVDPASAVGRELEHYLTLHSDQPVGQLQLGQYWFARGQPEKALNYFQRAVQWDTNSAPLRHELAIVLSTLNRPREAVAELEAACRLDPREAEFQYKLGLAWNELGDTAKTIAALEAAVRLAPGHARALYNLGLAYQGQGRSELAIETLIRAESAAPNDARVPYALATIYAQTGRRTEARNAAARALQVQPNFTAARELLRQL